MAKMKLKDRLAKLMGMRQKTLTDGQHKTSSSEVLTIVPDVRAEVAADASSMLSGEDETKSNRSVGSEVKRKLATFLEPWRKPGVADSQESTPTCSPAKLPSPTEENEEESEDEEGEAVQPLPGQPPRRQALDAGAGNAGGSPPRDGTQGPAAATAVAVTLAAGSALRELDRRSLAMQRKLQQLSMANGTATSASSLETTSVASLGSSSLVAGQAFMLSSSALAAMLPQRDSGSSWQPRRDSNGSMARRDSLQSNGSSAVGPDAELEGLVWQLVEGSVEGRSAAAERLFNRTAEDEALRLKASTLATITPLTRLLYDGRERGRMYAAYALSSIILPSTPLADMRAAGTIPALINVLNSSKVLASKKGAMRALGRLARSADTATEIVASGGLPPIIALLDSDDPALVRRCLIALYFIGADREQLQLEIMQAGAVPGAVRLCSSSYSEVQAEAADLLKVLARNPRAAAVTVDAGGLEALGGVAAQGMSARAKEGAIKALQRLANMPALHDMVMGSAAAMFLDTQASTSDGSEVSKLADLMTQGLPSERQQAAAVIEDVAAADPEVSRDLAGAGVVEPLVDMLQSGNSQGQLYACRALAQMAIDKVARAHIIAAGAIPHLIYVLQDNSGAGGAAAGTMEKLAEHSGAASAMIQAHGVEALLGLLEQGGPDCSLPVISALHHLFPVDPSVAQRVVAAGGVEVLVRKSCRGATEVRIAALALLRDVLQASQHQLVPGIVARLAAVEHSPSEEVRALAGAVLDGALGAGPLVRAARKLQGRVGQLLMRIRKDVNVAAALEEALRLIPRSAFLPFSSSEEAWRCQSVMVGEAGVVMGNPQVEALALQALAPQPGHTFLDVGAGTGYLTLLAAHLMGETGRTVGVELVQSAVDYASERLRALHEDTGLGYLPLTFVHGSIFGDSLAASLGKFDRIHVGANCPKSRLRDLLRLLKPGGKMAVPCEGQLLLLTQPAGGPVPEPVVLGMVPASDSLIDDTIQGPSTPNPDAKEAHLATSPMASSPSRARSTGGTATLPSPRWPGPNSRESPLEPIKQALTGRTGSSGRHTWSSHHSSVSDSGILNSQAAINVERVEAEEDNGWFISRSDIRICRNAEGRKCRLGEGGFGVVYKALMNGVDEVAVKLVKADKPSAKELSLFHKEVKVLRQLHHRNIVQFYGACLDPGSMFFATELMKGGDLYSALRHHPETMRWERLGRKVALDVALGVNYLHTRRPPMMHRDLKSPNVLLSEEGVAKIADVGMVRNQVKDLVTAQPVMTPLWAAPEVIRHERASIKADVWSYGILIWELISGADITEHQPLAIARQMQPGTGQHKTLELPATCPPIAARIFVECTRMDPDARPTAQQIVEWLRK
ncbi:hypothetical protein WJX72_007116 [[Myrmecia] bisecta]|uniref:Protein kinase domain-containing protein n=1 Tax=[Myrmecia] bisecta TaxID=41462 RepID=A0AAW1PIN9_9CHLO